MKKKSASIILSALLIITLLGLGFLLIITLGKKTGELQLNLFDKNKLGTVRINVYPVGSEVFIDGLSMGVSPVEILISKGSYKLKITNKGYEPYDKTITLQPGKIVNIEYRLKYIPIAKSINEDVGFSSWTIDNQLLFYQNTNGEIHSYIDKDLVLFELPEYLLSISFSPNGDSYIANIFPALIPTLNFNQINGEEFKEIGSGQCPVYWLKNNSIITLCWKPKTEYPDLNEIQVWYGNPNESLIALNFQNPKDLYPVKQIRMSSNEELISFLNNDGLSIWDINQQSISYLFSIPSINSAEWDPSNPSRLGCIDTDNNLHILEAKNGLFTETKIKNINSPFQWIPNSNSIIYTTYNLEEGGSSFWKLDISNQSKEILVDPMIARGKVESFVLSYDGKKIAYQTDQSHLWLITIEE